MVNNALLSNNMAGGGLTSGHVTSLTSGHVTTGTELVSSPSNSHKMLQAHHKFKLVKVLKVVKPCLSFIETGFTKFKCV